MEDAFLCRSAPDSFYRREGLTVVGFAWLACATVGCLPYVLTGVIPDFIGAYFETMSGFTTTGASVMPSMEVYGDGLAVPKSILFWRCMTPMNRVWLVWCQLSSMRKFLA